MSNLRFGINNLVELCTLSSTPEPVNSIENLKTEHRARQTKWNDFTNETIVVEAVLDSPQWADFIALPGSNLRDTARIKFELFATDISTTDLLGMGFVNIVTPIALGIYRAGIHPYNTEGRVSMANIFTRWFDAPIRFQRLKMTIEHGYPPEEPVPNTIPRQDPVSKLLSIEAETGVITNRSGESWSITSDGSASGGSRMTKSGSRFYRNPVDGPRLDYSFTASVTGAHEMWARVKSTSGANSFYSVLDGSSKTHILPLNAAWHWVKLRTVTLNENADYGLRIAARDYAFIIDKIEVRPPDGVVPVDVGEDESPVGYEDSTNNVSIRMLMAGQKVELDENFAHGNSIKFLNNPALQEAASGYSVPGKLQQEARRMRLNLPMMSQADEIALAQLEITLAGKPFLVSAYPDSAEWIEQAHTMLGLFADALSYEHRTAGFHRTQLTIHEA